MLKNFVKTALRNLFKHKGYSLINIAGLAIGMATCILILMFVVDELSYDSYNEHADRIYRVAMDAYYGGRDFNLAVAAAPMAQTMLNDYPEVEAATRFRQRGAFIFKYEDNTFRERDVVYADPALFEVFTIPLLKGDPETALKDPKTLILSRKTAEKYFRDEEPVGKTLKLNNADDYLVTAVFEEIPDNSHFHFDIMIAMEGLRESKGQIWMSQNFQTYVLLRQGTDPAAFEAKIQEMIFKYMGPQIEKFMGKSLEKLAEEGDMRAEYYLQPLGSIHLHSDIMAEMEPNSDIKYVYIFSAIALFILIIASINFMNLSTARAAGRAKEVGIRKVLGSVRSQLVRQFMTESFLLSLISMILALFLVWLALPAFNILSGKSLAFSVMATGSMLAALIIITVLTGFFAGSYPAFFISAFQPVNVLKGKLKTGIKTGPLRSGLVIFQFAASVILIVGTIIVYNQLQFIQNKKLGFNKEQVLMLDNTYLLGDQVEAFKNDLLNQSQVTNATVSSYMPVPSKRNNSAVVPEGVRGSNLTTSMQNWIVDYDYITTLRMNVVQGRDFSREFSTDAGEATIINQAAAKQFNWDKPVGKTIGRVVSNQGDIKLFTVIGVVEDFHFESLRETIGPLVMFLGEENARISLRVKTEDISGTVALMESKWKEFLPDQPFEYSFLDQRFNQMYENEQRIGKIFGVFAGFAIFIGCLGLFGLAAFTAEQRTKEIGIRKVLGASSPTIIRLLLKEFVLLVGAANLIAWPISYFVMRSWLQEFSYRISPGAWIFLAAGIATLFIAIITVSFQAIKAALADPIKSLRYE